VDALDQGIRRDDDLVAQGNIQDGGVIAERHDEAIRLGSREGRADMINEPEFAADVRKLHGMT